MLSNCCAHHDTCDSKHTGISNQTEWNRKRWKMGHAEIYTQHARDNNGDTIYTDFDGIMKIIEQTALIETFIWLGLPFSWFFSRTNKNNVKYYVESSVSHFITP